MAKQFAVVFFAGALIATVTAFLFLALYERESTPTIVIEDALLDVEIVVSVEGAVNRPGVYRLPGGARLNDAIVAAGGFAPGADFSELNLASRLADEQRVVIPFVGGPSRASPVARGDADSQDGDGLINVNAAGVQELDTLPGIGPVLAERIVAYRQANGPFTRVEELARIDGISPAMVDELRDRVTVGP